MLNESKSWLSEKKSTKIAQLTKKTKKRERERKSKRKKEIKRSIGHKSIGINRIRWKGYTTVNISDIQKIISNYYKQLYTNKSEDLKEIGRFLDICNLPKIESWSN